MPQVSFTLTQDWKFEDFLTYLLMVVASSDHDVDDEEVIAIRDTVEHLTDTTDEEFEVFLTHVQLFLQNQTIEEREEFIRAHKSVFIDSEEKRELALKGVEEVILADLNVDEGEMETFRYIKKLIQE